MRYFFFLEMRLMGCGPRSTGPEVNMGEACTESMRHKNTTYERCERVSRRGLRRHIPRFNICMRMTEPVV